VRWSRAGRLIPACPARFSGTPRCP
jgi:hypothetical protein